MTFQKGNKVNVGRKQNPEWVRKRCDKLIGIKRPYSRIRMLEDNPMKHPKIEKIVRSKRLKKWKREGHPLEGRDRPEISGSNHYRWKGGISFGKYSCEFNDSLKRRIKKRDNYTCQICNKTSLLVVHHRDFGKINNSDDNLISLCRNCHLHIHNINIIRPKFFQENMIVKCRDCHTQLEIPIKEVLNWIEPETVMK